VPPFAFIGAARLARKCETRWCVFDLRPHERGQCFARLDPLRRDNAFCASYKHPEIMADARGSRILSAFRGSLRQSLAIIPENPPFQKTVGHCRISLPIGMPTAADPAPAEYPRRFRPVMSRIYASARYKSHEKSKLFLQYLPEERCANGIAAQFSQSSNSPQSCAPQSCYLPPRSSHCLAAFTAREARGADERYQRERSGALSDNNRGQIVHGDEDRRPAARLLAPPGKIFCLTKLAG
jgi:hypothetical protein